MTVNSLAKTSQYVCKIEGCIRYCNTLQYFAIRKLLNSKPKHKGNPLRFLRPRIDFVSEWLEILYVGPEFIVDYAIAINFALYSHILQ